MAGFCFQVLLENNYERQVPGGKMSATSHAQMIEFGEGHHGYAVFIRKDTNPQRVMSLLKLDPTPKGVICISGGATAFPPEIRDRTVRLIENVIAPVSYKHALLVVDGGTETGVMQIIGEAFDKERVRMTRIIGGENGGARRKTGDLHDPLLMGFVPASKVTFPGDGRSPKPNIQLDRNHVYFVMVTDADDWGEEVEYMFGFIDHLVTRKKLPFINIIANGGRITIKEAHHAVQKGYHIVVLEGSKRATEVIVAALNGASQHDLAIALKQFGIVGTSPEQLQETLSWLNDIANYSKNAREKVARFDFLSRPLEELERLILSKLGLIDP